MSRDVSMVAPKQERDEDDPDVVISSDNILHGIVDQDNILHNKPVTGPLASHNYSMIDPAQEEEEKGQENLGDLDGEDEEFKNEFEESLRGQASVTQVKSKALGKFFNGLYYPVRISSNKI